MKIFTVSFTDNKDYHDIKYPIKINNNLASYYYVKNNIVKKIEMIKRFNNRLNKEE